MTVRMQLRRDTATNWSLNNPVLLSGEIGIETDTLKFKIGNGSRWNNTTSYALKVGQPGGVATLGPTGKLVTEQLPDSFSVSDTVASTIASLTTTSIAEGTNKYFTNQRAVDAVASSITTAINAALVTAASQAQTKADGAVVSANAYTDTHISNVNSNVSSVINSAIATEVANRNSAINALTTTQISEGTNKYFTDARAKAAVASDITAAIAASGSNLSSKTTNDLAEGSNNLYFTVARARAAAAYPIGQLADGFSATLDDINNQISTLGGSLDSLNNSLTSGSYYTAADRNVADGIAGLDSTTHIPDQYIPSTIARTSDVDSRINAIIGSAPSSLDTLQELAAALTGDNSMDEVITASLASKLSSVDAANTYATITNLALKASINNPTFTGTVNGITKSMVGLGNVDNTSDTNKPVSTATAIALSLKASLDSPTFTGTVDFSGATVNGIPQQDLSSYLTSSSAASTYLTQSNAASTYLTQSNASSTYATISNAQTYGYHNSNSGSTGNKIAYGTSSTPSIGSPVAGDIYIQY